MKKLQVFRLPNKCQLPMEALEFRTSRLQARKFN